MPYIGAKELKASDIRRFDVTSSTSATHTLTWTPPTEQSLIVTINGIKQHEDAYSVSGTTLTLSSPLVATDKLEVIGINDIGTTITPAQNSVNTDKIADDAVTSAKLANAINITSGNSLTIDSGATVTNNGTASGFGKVLQVVSTTKTDTWSSSLTSGSEADVTGLSVSITPSSTSSKILIMASVNGHNGAEGGLGVLITESGTMIDPPDSAGNKGNGKVHSNDIGLTNSEINTTTNFQILHSPSSTSTLTYQARVINYATTTRTFYLNRPSGTVRIYGVSTITAMEIEG